MTHPKSYEERYRWLFSADKRNSKEKVEKLTNFYLNLEKDLEKINKKAKKKNILK